MRYCTSGEDTSWNNSAGVENHSEVMLPSKLCICPRCGYACAGRTSVLCVCHGQRSISAIMTGCHWRSGDNVVERVEPHDDVAQSVDHCVTECSSVNKCCKRHIKSEVLRLSSRTAEVLRLSPRTAEVFRLSSSTRTAEPEVNGESVLSKTVGDSTVTSKTVGEF